MRIEKLSLLDWGKVLTWKNEALRTHIEKPMSETCSWNPNAGDAGTGGPLVLTGQPSLPDELWNKERPCIEKQSGQSS